MRSSRNSTRMSVRVQRAMSKRVASVRIPTHRGGAVADQAERDSPRDELIVTFFTLTVIGMLLYAAIRNRYRKAVESRGRPGDLREWTQVGGRVLQS